MNGEPLARGSSSGRGGRSPAGLRTFGLNIDDLRLVSLGSHRVVGVVDVNIVALVVLNVHERMFIVTLRDHLLDSCELLTH